MSSGNEVLVMPNHSGDHSAGIVLKVPANDEDIANKYYVDLVAGGGAGAVLSVFTRTGDVVAESGDYEASEITNTPAGGIVATEVQSAINELDTKKAGIADAETINGLWDFSTLPTSTVAPTTDYQFVNKAYADAIASGLVVKAACDAATTAEVDITQDLEAGDTIVGVTLAKDDRVLVKNQGDSGEDPAENGIYVVPGAGAASRATDYDSDAEVVAGTFTNVLGGTANANKQFVQTTPNPTLGTDPLVFTQLSAPLTYAASGEGLELAPATRTFSLELDGTSLTAGASGLKITAPVSVANGGTGLTSLGTANQVLGVNSGATGQEYKTITAGTNITVTHSANDIEIATSLSGSADAAYVPQVLHSHPASNFVWTNMPLAITAGSSYLRKKVDLTGAVAYRIVVNQGVAGTAGSYFRVKYSLNNSTFFDIGATNSGDLNVGTGLGVKTGTWENIVVGAKTDVWLQLYGYGGDGVVDPAWRQIEIQIKYNSSIISNSTTDDFYREATIHSHPASSCTWTNMPAAVTEFIGGTYNRVKMDLTGCTHYRIVVNQAVAGYAGADLNLQYSTNGSAFSAADTSAAGEIDVGTGTGIKYGSWAALVDAAKGDVWLRIVGKEGDGVADPQFRQVIIQFKGYVRPYNVVSTSAQAGDYTLTDNDYFVVFDSAAPATATLPAATTGKVFVIKNIGAGAVAITPDGLETIDGAGSYNLPNLYDAITLVGELDVVVGGRWHITALVP